MYPVGPYTKFLGNSIWNEIEFDGNEFMLKSDGKKAFGMMKLKLKPPTKAEHQFIPLFAYSVKGDFDHKSKGKHFGLCPKCSLDRSSSYCKHRTNNTIEVTLTFPLLEQALKRTYSIESVCETWLYYKVCNDSTLVSKL